MYKILILSLFAGAALLSGCTASNHHTQANSVQSNRDAPLPPQVNKNIGMANPADVYCTQLGGKLNAKQNPQGQYSTCTLPNGQEIESWTLFRRDHPVKK
ncbi:DUF333 domain-containing protein [Serratia sp. S1B]|nr:DUF333 domain-containing protein [Serratia sp. S1B]